MEFASVRIITDDLDRLVAFYERVLEVPAARPAPVFAEFRTATAALAIGSVATVVMLRERAPRPGSNSSAILEFLVSTSTPSSPGSRPNWRTSCCLRRRCRGGTARRCSAIRTGTW